MKNTEGRRQKEESPRERPQERFKTLLSGRKAIPWF